MDVSGSTSRFESDLPPTVGEALGTSGVIHDLGNLIQIAASSLNAISRRREGRDPVIDPIVARARIALDRAGVLIRHTMSRGADTTLVVRRPGQPQCVASCLKGVEELISWVCQPDIALIVDIDENLPPVRCNPVDLQNAVLNLVINARDAMPDGGALRVTLRCAGGSQAPAEVEIIVADDGCGMSSATLRRAFTPYFTTKPDGRGGGLGLAMVKRFAEEAGGRVDIASSPEVGTMVTIGLPPAAW